MSIRHALLALLSEGPKYGFQLRQEFEEGTGDVWPLNVGQVYSTLQRLEHSGHIESDDSADDGPQKVFRLTEEGKSELHRWLSTPTDMASPPRDELVIKVLSALRVPGIDVNDVIQLHRRYLESSCSSGHTLRMTRPTSILPLLLWSTPSYPAWTRSSVGSTRPKVG